MAEQRNKIWQKIRPHYRKFRKGTIERFFVAKKRLIRNIGIFFVLPIILYSFYTLQIQVKKYEASGIIMVDNKGQQDASALSPLAALAGNFSSGNLQDLMLLVEYIKSNSMLEQLEQKFFLKEKYQKVHGLDYFSTLKKDDIVSFIKYYNKLITLEINEDSNVLVIKYRDYDKDRALEILQEIIFLSEKFLNEVSDKVLAKEIKFYEDMLEEVLVEIRKTQHFMSQKQLASKQISPTKTFEATTATIAEIEAGILKQKAELAQMTSYLSSDALQIKVAKEKIAKLQKQIKTLKVSAVADEQQKDPEFSSVSFATAEIELMLLLEKYKLTLQSLETHKFNAIHSAKHLVEIARPFVPDKAQYPKPIRNILVFILIYSLVIFIAKVIVEIVKEHKYY